MFENFWGNDAVVRALEQMIEQERIPQTLLLSGPEGVGKATLARRFAARLLGGQELIEQDDLSRPESQASIGEREKWPADRRNEDSLLFASLPDFVTFCPDGPLRQITIQQMRLLKERARFKPLHGRYRVFLIDQLDRANEQAANSLLKTLEEPPEHLILFLTANNPYDLLATIRSRAVPFHLGPLSDEEMREFAGARGLADAERRITLAQGSPGLAVSIDLETYERRRAAMLALLRVAAGAAPFSDWLRATESGGARQDKLDALLMMLYTLLGDVLRLQQTGGPVANADLRQDLEALAGRLSLEWLRGAVNKVDELADLARRNIQKTIALDDLIIELRPA